MLAHHTSTLFQVLGLVIGHQNPRWLFSGQKAGDCEALNIVVNPIKSAHSDDVACSTTKRLDGRFQVGKLFETKVSMCAVGANGSLNLKTNAIVP